MTAYFSDLYCGRTAILQIDDNILLLLLLLLLLILNVVSRGGDVKWGWYRDCNSPQFYWSSSEGDDEGSGIATTRWVLWDKDRAFIDWYNYRVLVSLSLYSITNKLYTDWVRWWWRRQWREEDYNNTTKNSTTNYELKQMNSTELLPARDIHYHE